MVREISARSASSVVAAVVSALVLLLTAMTVLHGTWATAAEASTVTLSAPPSAVDGATFELEAVVGSGGGAVSGTDVVFERWVGDAWTAEATRPTDDGGRAVALVIQDASTAPGVFRAVVPGDGEPDVVSEQVTVALAETAGELVVGAPEQGVIGRDVSLRLQLRRADDGTPLAGEQLRLERRVGDGWRRIDVLVTDADGRAGTAVPVRRERSANRFRAVFAGSGTVAPARSAVVSVVPVRARTVLQVLGPGKVVDETEVTLAFRWRARDGRDVPGSGRLWSRAPGQDWRRGPRLEFGRDGETRLRVGPRVDTRWKVVGRGGPWWRGDVSEVHLLDNVPPGDPVVYPPDAPRPRVKVPRQPRAVGEGPNPTVTGIPDAVWNQMTGRSWHSGCPVGRSELRLVRINYWGYDGYRYRGELVVRDDIAAKTVGAFSALYQAQLPIRSMYRVDRFGWSAYLHGGNNYDSMAAGNTSGFNCRGVVGNPGVPSPHSYGRAIDLNTWENPYHSRRGIVPNVWWASRSHPRIAWRSGEHPVVRIMRAHGFRWTYGSQDSQHFDG